MWSIEVQNLTKYFGKFKVVDNISFEVAQGEIFGFLGANGAGKSTTIRMLIGILSPTEGDAIVGGVSVRKNPNKIRGQIGYMSQKFSLYSDLTVLENILFFANVYDVGNDTITKKISFIKEITGLDNLNVLTGKLPTGFKQRIALGIALLHDPKIVFLDEPTSGTDPISRRAFWELIQKLAESGKTVFVTTHYLEEAEYCNRIALINHGKIIALGSPTQLKNLISNRSLFEIEFESKESTFDFLCKEREIGIPIIFGTKIHLFCFDRITENEVWNFVQKKYRGVTKVVGIIPTLEDVFLQLLEKG